ALQWAREITAKSPTAQRMLKFAFNLVDDGLMGQQVFAGEATRLAYMTEEAQEGRDAFLEKRPPDFAQFSWLYWYRRRTHDQNLGTRCWTANAPGRCGSRPRRVGAGDR